MIASELKNYQQIHHFEEYSE
ncbi:hypothetical protein CY0110_17532 [Crocosphaera chwakensis CCY0110]|uniref:Uncharacterized protein n=1 Tax=Crocosphaera chwakensis CCY0110 TaxID=391612 RepID=A3III8_9CHRO|nr:hypothetical protein CY0110_17532 [Crocosphaera chwakensis CCY0110]